MTGLDQAKNATKAMVSTESCTLMGGATATPSSLALVLRQLDQAKTSTSAMVSTAVCTLDSGATATPSSLALVLR